MNWSFNNKKDGYVLKGTLQEIPCFHCLKPAMSRSNTQSLKPPASITKKLQTFQNDSFSTMKILKDFHCTKRKFQY